jgi:formate dehydrogenase assembly factor FdhD
MIVTLSAPTSLAIDLAASGGITLVGFSRAHRHLAYCHPHRLVEEVKEAKEVSHDSI